MAGDSTPPPPPPPPSTDHLIPFSIPNKVPVKLDLDKHNYISWSSFFLIHLGSLGLKTHIEAEPSSSTPSPEWCKLDDLIKMWILGSLCDSLQEQVVSTPGYAKALWDHIKDLFHDNKDARAINLDNELRSIKIGNMSINEYCTKIKSMAARLKNLGSAVSDKNLVMYAVNGLDSRFTTIAKIIRHQLPLPTFEAARTMLLLEESSFREEAGTINTFESSSSSPTVLVATNTSGRKVTSSSHNSKPQNLPQLCNHFNKGTCKFGERCKYIHDHRNRPGLTPSRTSNQTSFIRPYGFPVPNQPTSWVSPGLYQSRQAQQITPLAHPQASQQAHYQQQAYLAQTQQPVQPLTYTQPSISPGLLGPAPALNPSQATSLPTAYSTMTLQDPTWNMDTGFLDSPYPPSM